MNTKTLQAELTELPIPYAPLALVQGKRPKYTVVDALSGERVASGVTLDACYLSLNRFLSIN